MFSPHPITPIVATSLHWPSKIEEDLLQQFFAMRLMVAISPDAFIL
jgi:hypothetical protein